MLRLTETEIRDTLKFRIRPGTLNMIIDDLQAIEDARSKSRPNGNMLRICRFLEDGKVASVIEIADTLGEPRDTIRNLLNLMGERVGKYKFKDRKLVQWFIEKPGIDYIREKAARGY